MTELIQDIRYAFRQLRKKPGFTLAAVTTLSLGIAANVAIFSIVNGILLRPLPVPQPQQIVVLAAQQKNAQAGFGLSYPELTDFRKQTANVFSDLLAYEVNLAGISADNRADQFFASYVTGNYFSGLGLKPALGRLFLPGEGERPGAEPLVVIGYSFWQRRFGGSADVIGKRVLVNGKPATVIGVTPREFHGTTFAVDSDGYLPFGMAAVSAPDLWTNRSDRQWTTMGRLKPGVSMAQAQTAVGLVQARLAQQYPATDKEMRVDVVPETLSRPEPGDHQWIAISAGLFLFFAAVILALAAVNVTNILLVRTTAREGEMAIRAAMGAGRRRLVALVMTESILLASLGAAAGIAIGIWASSAIARIPVIPGVLTSLDFGLDWHVLAYSCVIALGAGIAVGLWPALRVARADVNEVLRGSGRSGSIGTSRHRLRNVLVAAQMAGSLVLLIIAGLLVRSLQSAQRMYLGFDANHLLNLVLDPHQVGYDESRTDTFYKELEERVRALPGVQSASLAYSVPIGLYRDGDEVAIEGHPTPPGMQLPFILFNAVEPTYFSTMKIPLVRGRIFTDADNDQSLPVAIVNQTMAQRFWPNEDPIGKRFRTGVSIGWRNETRNIARQVVGIAQNGKYGSLNEDFQPYFYVPLAQKFTSMRVLHIRTSLAPEALIVPVQQQVKSLDSGLPIFSLRTMADDLAGINGFMAFRIGALLASCIGGMGLIMAAVGVYGVVALAASLRTREIGIRIALGASRREVLMLVLRQGLWVVLIGVAVGQLLTFAISRLLAGLLIGVSATDPITFNSCTVFLLAVALYACYVPARRAMKFDPMVALRCE